MLKHDTMIICLPNGYTYVEVNTTNLATTSKTAVKMTTMMESYLTSNSQREFTCSSPRRGCIQKIEAKQK